MAGLALAVQGERPEGMPRVLLPANRRTADAAFHHLGQKLLCYWIVRDVMLVYRAMGRLAALEAPDSGRLLVRIEDLEPLAQPVPAPEEARLPGARSHLVLTAGRFEAVLAASKAPAAPLAEAGAVFDPSPTVASAAPYLAIHDQVLARWGFRCALTGEWFGPADRRPHPALEIVAIRPRKAGGPLHTRNFLPLGADAAYALREGALTLADDFAVLVNTARLDPALLPRLLPRLLLPEDETQWPDRDLIRFHRHEIARF